MKGEVGLIGGGEANAPVCECDAATASQGACDGDFNGGWGERRIWHGVAFFSRRVFFRSSTKHAHSD